MRFSFSFRGISLKLCVSNCPLDKFCNCFHAMHLHLIYARAPRLKKCWCLMFMYSRIVYTLFFLWAKQKQTLGGRRRRATTFWIKIASHRKRVFLVGKVFSSNRKISREFIWFGLNKFSKTSATAERGTYLNTRFSIPKVVEKLLPTENDFR